MKNDKVSYTSVSELIVELQKILDKHGDLPVCVGGASPIYTDLLPYYYDGGFVLQDVNDSSNYLRSRTWNPDKKYTEVTEGFPKNCVYLRDTQPHEYLKLSGRTVPEIDTESWEFLDKKEFEERNIFGGQLVKYKWSEEYSKELKGYPVIAYLDSGELSLGSSRFEAKNNLIDLVKANKK